MMKTSGSKRNYLCNGSFSEERNTKKYKDVENLPKFEGMRSTYKFYNGKINYELLRRFLFGQVGKNWADISLEISARIPSRLLHHKEFVNWYVADQVEFISGKLWNRRSQKFINLTGKFEAKEERMDFYVDPISNILVKI